MDDSDMRHATLRIDGMTCVNCQSRIEKCLLKSDGVTGATVSWEKGTASVDFDERKITADEITARIEKLGYTVVRGGGRDKASGRILRALLYVGIIAGLFMILQKTGVMNLLVPSSLAASGMSLALLFVTGLLTSVHCVAMCGGINLSQSLSRQRGTGRNVTRADFFPALLYNLGRVASYTLIGLMLGTAGFFLGGQPGGADGAVTLPLSLQGILKLAAGVFMILTGISMLGLFPFLRNITPHLPASLSKKIARAQTSAKSSALTRNAAPLIVGILNGFMPCGPLQAMWLVALASGHPLYGALSMAVFGAGTAPLMLGLGSVISILGKKYTEVVMKIAAVLVVVMGLSMLTQGFALGGWNFPSGTSKGGAKKTGADIVMQDGKQVVRSKLTPSRYPKITVKKGIPVRWEIEAGEGDLNGCNYKMVFRDFGFEYEMGYGTNVIEFTPEKSGSFQYTCWMGMIRGVVEVEE